MGRGRAKAKQTKVARALKYSSPSTDFERLQRELSGGAPHSQRNGVLSDDSYSGVPTSQWDDDDEDEGYDDWRR